MGSCEAKAIQCNSSLLQEVPAPDILGHSASLAASLLHPFIKHQLLLPVYPLATPCFPGAPVSSALPQGEAQLGSQPASTVLMLGPSISPTLPVARKG